MFISRLHVASKIQKIVPLHLAWIWINFTVQVHVLSVAADFEVLNCSMLLGLIYPITVMYILLIYCITHIIHHHICKLTSVSDLAITCHDIVLSKLFLCHKMSGVAALKMLGFPFHVIVWQR